MERGRSTGFTLLELLLVIAILGILSQAAVVVLNPVEILAKARDSRRLADLNAINSALSFYLVNVRNPELDDPAPDANDNCVNGTASSTLYSHHFGIIAPPGWKQAINTSTPYRTDGNGWIRVNLKALESGSPLTRFPIDPAPRGPEPGPGNDFYYVYGCDAESERFEILANMESKFFGLGGSADVESADGGALPSLYETGTQLRILPSPAPLFYWDE